MGTVSNLQVGTGTLYVGPAREPLPEVNNLAPPAVTITPAGNWVATGFTAEEHKLELTESVEEIEVNEHKGAVKFYTSKEGGKFGLTMAESDFLALSRALGGAALTTVAAGADQTAQDRLKFGDGTYTEKALLYVFTSPEGGSRLIYMPLAAPSGGLKIVQGKKFKGVEMEWMLGCNTSATAGERVAALYDITATASS